jgi:hypothetical protein
MVLYTMSGSAAPSSLASCAAPSSTRTAVWTGAIGGLTLSELFLNVTLNIGTCRLGYNHAYECRPVTRADVDKVKSKMFSERVLEFAKL